MSLNDHVAIAVDVSETSEIAARGGFRYAELAGAKKITLINACRKVVMPHGAQPTLRKQLEDLQQREIDAALRASSELAGRQSPGAEIRHEVIAGRPSEVVPEVVRRVGASLLVLGTHARRGVKRIFMGSIAESVLARVEVPSLVLHVGGDEVPPDVELQTLERALVAIDITEESRRVVDVAVELVESLRRPSPRIVLLHVVEPPPLTGAIGGEPIAEILAAYRSAALTTGEQTLAAIKEELGARFAGVDVEVAEGIGSDTILAQAKLHDVQAIVIGTHGAGRAPLLELGGVTGDVIRRSDVVVLVVPSHGRRDVGRG